MDYFTRRIVICLDETYFGGWPSNVVASIREDWAEFKAICEGGRESVNPIIDSWLTYCNLESNKALPKLDIEAGGIGEAKQIIFRKPGRYDFWKRDNLVVLKIRDGDDRWSPEELIDLVSAFVKYARYHIDENYVMGRIELNHPSFLDDTVSDDDEASS